MDNERTGRSWMVFAGIALLGAGVIGFLGNNPIASAAPNALFQVNAIHNVIHLATGGLALYISTMRGRALASGLIGFGALYAVVAVLLVVDPKLFGLFNDAPANIGDHLLHAALAVVSIALGMMMRSSDRQTVTAR